MEADAIRLAVICVIAGLIIYANNRLNKVAELKNIITTVTIVVAVIFCLAPVIDLIQLALHSGK